MSTFIVRPFNTQKEIDFERVETELIQPVLKELGIRGATTQEIAAAGNIRLDMFDRLLMADLVIADISIHNANVYYELGIRHALRDRSTILIRASGDEVVFDLKTDRYLKYDAADPGASRPELRRVVQDTLAGQRADSPVYLLLPELKPNDPSTLRPVPESFQAAVATAVGERDFATLGLLGEELDDHEWEISARRLIARAQWSLKRLAAARATYEEIRKAKPRDIEANLRLATIYQRLRDLPRSNAAIKTVLEGDRGATDCAESRALLASNIKTAWVEEWRARSPADRIRTAIRSQGLYDSADGYVDGFNEDQNHYYSGINALAMNRLILTLIERDPGAWAGRFLQKKQAESAHEEVRELVGKLESAVLSSLDGARYRKTLKEEHEPRSKNREYDPWLDLSLADWHLLTCDNPDFVEQQYDAVRTRWKNENPNAAFPADSAARQIRMYLDLGVFGDNARAALRGLNVPEVQEATPMKARPRIIVFTGHRLDAPGRKTPRFPASKEQVARDEIQKVVTEEKELALGGDVSGIAGGASGGDILFHEVCAELGIPTALLLALPPDQYARESVADAGPGWVERFRKLRDRVSPQILSESKDLPEWLRDRDNYSIWNRNNLWTLHHALAHEDVDVTLIALWNGQGGDGPGGTEDMVKLAQERGVKVVILDTKKLFGVG